MEHLLGYSRPAFMLVCVFVQMFHFHEDTAAIAAFQEISQKPHRFAAAAVTLPFRLPHNCCSFLNRSWGFRCCGFLSSLRPSLRGSWAFGEVVAEDSPLRHMMSLSQLSAQTWKTTLWPLHTHTHTKEHTTPHITLDPLRLWLKWLSISHLTLTVLTILSIVSFAVSWPEHGIQ